MLYTYGSARNLYGQLTNDTSSANLANGDSYINAELGRILNLRQWPFLFRESPGTTVANQQYVPIPANYRKVNSVKLTSGTTIHTPKEVPNREFWDRLNYNVASATTADFPQWWYVFNNRCHFWPTPSTERSVTFFGRIGFKGLSISEISTGQVTTATPNSTTLVGTGSTAWAAPLAGRYIKVAEANVGNRGDGEWYEIASVTDATNLELARPYLGAAITAGTAYYTIGQISPIPDGYQEAPIYHAAHIYFSSKNVPGSADKSTLFKGMRDDLEDQLVSDYGNATDNVIVDDASIDEVPNPNLMVRL